MSTTMGWSCFIASTLVLLGQCSAQAGDVVPWPMDKQAHFLAGYGIGLSSSLAYKRMGLPVPWLLGMATVSAAAYAKEKSDAVYDAEDLRKTVQGGALGVGFYWVVNL